MVSVTAIVFTLIGASMYGIGTPMFKQASEHIGEISYDLIKEDVTGFLKSFLGNRYFLGGVVFGIFGWVIWTVGLNMGDVTIIGPMSAISYVITPFYSRFFMDEKLTQREMLGIGIALVALAILGGA